MRSAPAVPFYGNLPDDTHCLQASLRSALKYFLPDREYTWEELEKFTDKLPGKATWPVRMVINLADMGFDVNFVEAFDARRFVKEGGEYLRAEFGEAVASWQIKHSDIAQEQANYAEMLDHPRIHYEQRIPGLEDIRSYLERGYLVKASVNASTLDDKPGYSGHSILIYDMDDTTVTLHNPGLPPIPGQRVEQDKFVAAWSYPNDKAREIIAIKYEGN